MSECSNASGRSSRSNSPSPSENHSTLSEASAPPHNTDPDQLRVALALEPQPNTSSGTLLDIINPNTVPIPSMLKHSSLHPCGTDGTPPKETDDFESSSARYAMPTDQLRRQAATLVISDLLEETGYGDQVQYASGGFLKDTWNNVTHNLVRDIAGWYTGESNWEPSAGLRKLIAYGACTALGYAAKRGYLPERAGSKLDVGDGQSSKAEPTLVDVCSLIAAATHFLTEGSDDGAEQLDPKLIPIVESYLERARTQYDYPYYSIGDLNMRARDVSTALSLAHFGLIGAAASSAGLTVAGLTAPILDHLFSSYCGREGLFTPNAEFGKVISVIPKQVGRGLSVLSSTLMGKSRDELGHEETGKCGRC